MNPYRAIDATDERVATESELVYSPAARGDRQAGVSSALRIVALPSAVGAAAWQLAGGTIGLIAVLASGAASLWYARRRPKDVVVLRVQGGTLRVVPYGAKTPVFAVALEDLRDITLETKTVERIVEGDPNLGATYLNARIAPPTDTNRIVLETNATSFPLTQAYFGHADTVEWFAKIRVFLRNAGWVPAIERERVDAEEEEEEEEGED